LQRIDKAGAVDAISYWRTDGIEGPALALLCALRAKSFNTESTEALSGLCVDAFPGTEINEERYL
jgi:hypothetical protein